MEVAHGQVVTHCNPHIGNAFSILIELSNGLDNIIKMLLVQLVAVDSKTNNIANFLLLLRCLQVIFHGIVTRLGSTDTVAADQFDAEAPVLATVCL